MRKKGMVFYVGIVLVALVLLTTTMISLKGLQDELPDYPIGEQQFSILNAYESISKDGEDLAWMAKKAADRAMLDLAKNGGHNVIKESESASDNPCGTSGNFELWNLGTTECFPDPQSAFESYFNDHMLDMQLRWGQEPVSYSLTLSDEVIYGSAGRKVQYTKPVRAIPVPITGTSQIVCPAMQLSAVTYATANAINGDVHGCTQAKRDAKECTFLLPSEFASLCAVEDPRVEIARPGGNAMVPELAQFLVDIAAKWQAIECAGVDNCQARLHVSSIGTGRHSAGSMHNLGRAIDVSRCIDKDGKTHYASSYNTYDTSTVYGRCYKMVYDEARDRGFNFIGQWSCLGFTAETCSEQKLYHSDHMHIDYRT
ncbi:hypothetical protein H6504_03545 [Candidatus Woesearchaeota archaeon]|nr:hypothetical protein [Candidatus Woesearchaeota archaeon]